MKKSTYFILSFRKLTKSSNFAAQISPSYPYIMETKQTHITPKTTTPPTEVTKGAPQAEGENGTEEPVTPRKPTKPRTTAKKKKRKKKRKKMPLWKKIMWWTVGIVSFFVLLVIFCLALLWWRGLLPTREELPRYKAHLIYMLEGFKPTRLPEGDVIGIDISHYQGDVEWEYLSFYIDKERKLHRSPSKKTKPRQVDFVIAKATQGANNRDSHYNRYKAGAREQNIQWGAYHFYSYQASATAQADNFIKTARLQSGDMTPILDVEPYQNTLPPKDSVLRWLQVVEKYYGMKPIIYTSENCYLTYFSEYKPFNKYSYWIARYGGREPSRHHIMWQYCENGKVAGVSGPVDIDIFRGTAADLKHKYTLP